MSEITDVKIHESWKAVLQDEFQQPYFAAIKQFLVTECWQDHLSTRQINLQCL